MPPAPVWVVTSLTPSFAASLEWHELGTRRYGGRLPRYLVWPLYAKELTGAVRRAVSHPGRQELTDDLEVFQRASTDASGAAAGQPGPGPGRSAAR